VAEILKGRYAPGSRPLSWDERIEDFEVIKTGEGETLTLLSGGGQSTPASGWELLLTDEVIGGQGFRWTLYGVRG
jgi:hypothetical protein